MARRRASMITQIEDRALYLSSHWITRPEFHADIEDVPEYLVGIGTSTGPLADDHFQLDSIRDTTPDNLADILSKLNQHYQDHKPLLIYCDNGATVSGLFASLLLAVTENRTLEQSLSIVHRTTSGFYLPSTLYTLAQRALDRYSMTDYVKA